MQPHRHTDGPKPASDRDQNPSESTSGEPIERLTLNAGEVALQCRVEELRDRPIVVAVVVLWQDRGLEVEWRTQGGGPHGARVGGGAGGGHGGLDLAGLS